MPASPQPLKPRHEILPVSTPEFHQAILDAWVRAGTNTRAFMEDPELENVITRWFQGVPSDEHKSYDFLHARMGEIGEAIGLGGIQKKALAQLMLKEWVKRTTEAKKNTWAPYIPPDTTDPFASFPE